MLSNINIINTNILYRYDNRGVGEEEKIFEKDFLTFGKNCDIIKPKQKGGTKWQERNLYISELHTQIPIGL